MNKTKQSLILVSMVLIVSTIVPANAQQFSKYGGMQPDSVMNQIHSQGNDFQCATSSTVELICEVENVLKLYLPQIVTNGDTTNDRLQKIIDNQNTEIENQKTLIQLLEKLVPTPVQQTVTPIVPYQKNCHKSGTGELCG